MGKLILLIVFGVVVYLLLKRGRRPRDGQPRPEAEAMAQCAHCGVHVPLSESIAAGDERYCCEEHRRLAGR